MIDEFGYVVNVDGVVVRDDEFLLIERGGAETHAVGQLAFPGGKLEGHPDGDAVATTARRELAEEVGVEVGEVTYVHSSTFEADDGSPCLNVLTRCEYVGGEARPRDQDEVAAVHWLTQDAIRRRDDVPEFLTRYVTLVADDRDTA